MKDEELKEKVMVLVNELFFDINKDESLELLGDVEIAEDTVTIVMKIKAPRALVEENWQE